MKDKSYTIVIAGKIVEHPSLLEIKTTLDKEQWKQMVGNTVEFYIQMLAASRTGTLTDSKDVRIMRSLKRTAAVLERRDPTTYAEFYSPAKVQQYEELVQKEMANMGQVSVAYGDKPDINSDITIKVDKKPDHGTTIPVTHL